MSYDERAERASARRYGAWAVHAINAAVAHQAEADGWLRLVPEAEGLRQLWQTRSNREVADAAYYATRAAHHASLSLKAKEGQ